VSYAVADLVQVDALEVWPLIFKQGLRFANHIQASVSSPTIPPIRKIGVKRKSVLDKIK
jgi:hypothetical protein